MGRSCRVLWGEAGAAFEDVMISGFLERKVFNVLLIVNRYSLRQKLSLKFNGAQISQTKGEFDGASVLVGQVSGMDHFEFGLAIEPNFVSSSGFYQPSSLRFNLESKGPTTDATWSWEIPAPFLGLNFGNSEK